MLDVRRANSLDALIALFAPVALAFAMACGGGAAAPARDGASTIGSSGGTVSLSGGPHLDVPAGALAAATTLTVQQSVDTAPSGAPIYRLGPDGTTFAQPVTITLPLPAGVAAPAVYWSKPGSATAFDVVPATVTAGAVVAQGSHFSSVFVGPSTGSAVCTNAGPGSDGTACGGGLVCTGGLCGATLSGTVSGAATSGVTVTLGGAAVASTTTDASGHYQFPALAAGSYTVTPSLPGYAFTPASAAATITTASVTGEDFTDAGASAISGTVSGSAAAGVTMSLTGSMTASTTTDASGNYAFAGVIPGSYTVTPSLPGYAFTPASAAATITTASVSGEDFSDAGAYAISGTVSGPAAAGVTVSLTGAMTASTTTDASGNYAFAGVIPGSYTVTPSLPGYAFTPASAAATITTASVTGEDFTDAGASVISGTISGSSAAGVTVSLTGAMTASTTTDASGNYAFAGVIPGSYTVTPSLPGYAFNPTSAPVTVTMATAAARDFAEWRPLLQAASPSEGHVGASVTLTGSLFGAAGSGGSVTLGGVPMAIVSWSDAQIVASVPSGAGAGGVQVHAGGADSVAQPFTVTATLSGQLTDGSGSALAGNWAFGGDGYPAQLTVSAVGTGRSALAATVQGAGWGALPQAFSLELPLGTYTLAVQERDGQGNANVDLLQDASRQWPNVVVGEAGAAGLELPLRWHWEVSALDPGYPVCGQESQIWFRDALHGLATFKVSANVDPTLDPALSSHIHGMAMATNDGGRTWSVASADMSASFDYFYPTDAGWFPNGNLLALDDGTALSIGDNGKLVRSTDFGQTWSPVWLGWEALGPGNASPTRFARAGDRLWVSVSTGGVQGSVERTSLVTSIDEGLTWTKRFDVCNPNYYAPGGCGSQGVPLGFAGIDMACSDVDPQRCITMGYEHDNYTSLVMVTRDGFQTFSSIAPKCGYFTDGQVIWLPGTSTAWVKASTSCPGVGVQYIVTTDGGQTWTDWSPAPFTGKIAFADAMHGAGWWDSGVWMTRDAGATWIFTGHAPAGAAGMKTVQMLDADHAWALGNPDCRYSSAAYVSRWVP